MIKQLMSIFFVFSLGLTFAGCGGGADEDDGTQAEVKRQNEKLKSDFSKVVGLYKGTLNTAEKNRDLLDVELVVYWVMTQEGVDENGKVKERVTLLTQFRLPNVVGELDDHLMRVNYDINSGEVSMTADLDLMRDLNACSVGRRDPQLSILGTMLKDEMKGKLRLAGGVLGTLNLQRVNRNVDTVILDQYDRLWQAYEPIVGEYLGQYTPSDKTKKGFPFQLNLILTGETTGSGNSFVVCPTLKGQYTRPDVGGNIGIMSLNVEYFPWTSRIVIKSTGEGPGLPGSKDLSIIGTWNEGLISGTFEWFGNFGTAEAQKVK